MAKWLKLDTGILSDEKIDLIRTLPAGDSLFVLWVGLLCLAMKKESDRLYIADGIPYTPEVLAKVLHLEPDTVKLGLETFERFGMIDVEEGTIVISNLPLHQAMDKLTHVRDLGKERARRFRDRKRIESVTRFAVTESLPEVEVEVEVEKKDIVELKPDHVPYSDILNLLNQTCGTNYKAKTQATRHLIKARWNEGYRLDDFEQVIKAKWAEWKGDDKFVKFLRPQTLFGTKFESYLQNVSPVRQINKTDVRSWKCEKCGKVQSHSMTYCYECGEER